MILYMCNIAMQIKWNFEIFCSCKVNDNFTMNINQRQNKMLVQILNQIFYYKLIRICKAYGVWMNKKFTIDQYEICTSFKSDNLMTVSAQYLPTGQFFLRQNVQLMRIKKDTVIATLERKSQKNLRCEIEQYIDKTTKTLVLKFIINFDFLPEFSQEVALELVEKKENIKSMQVNNFKAEIEQIQSMLDAFEQNGVGRHTELGTVTFTAQQAQELKKIKLPRGKYLIKISGIYTNSLGQLNSHDKMTLSIQIPGQKQKVKKNFTLYSNSGYSYPFSCSQVLNTEEGEVIVKAQGPAANWNLTNTHVYTCPVADLA